MKITVFNNVVKKLNSKKRYRGNKKPKGKNKINSRFIKKLLLMGFFSRKDK